MLKAGEIRLNESFLADLANQVSKGGPLGKNSKKMERTGKTVLEFEGTWLKKEKRVTRS